jgi:transposase-like protein
MNANWYDLHCGRFTTSRARPRKTRSRPGIEHCYRDFLLQNYDPDEREYPDATDQIREVLKSEYPY